MTERELRYSLDSQFEARSEGNKFTISGYAAVFNSRSQNLGGFVEEIRSGAFKKTINESDVRALWNHNADHVLGRSRSETLRLSEDSTGLQYEVDLPDTEFARGLYESIKRGDVSQSSFGFATIDDEWGFTDDEFPLRTLKEVQLFDVSPVTFPAYRDATIGVRALERLAIHQNKDIAEVRDNLASVIKGNVAPVSATPVGRYFESSEVIRLRGRLGR